MSQQTLETVLDADTIRQYETEYVLYPWQAQKGLSPVVVDHAKGNYFYDSSGKRYLDFTAQLVFSNLGHADERVVAAIARQAGKLPTSASPFATEPKARLAKLLAKALQEGVYCLPGSVSVIMLAPPLTITKDEIDFAMDVLDGALAIADAEVER